MNYVVMDLEFNYPHTRFRSEQNGITLHSEIVEIGAVKLNEALEETGRFCCFIKPSIYYKMHGDVSKLTEITTDMIWEGKDFKDALKEFLAWCGTDSGFVTWSDNDIIVLEENMLYHGIATDDLPKCYNIQWMFDDQITGRDQNMALTYAMWKLGIKPVASHDALNDALNTAEVLRRLDLSEGLDDYEV